MIRIRTWYVRFSGPGPDGRSKQYKISLSTSDYALALTRAWDYYYEIRGPEGIGKGNPLLAEILPTYERYLRATKGEKTAANQWSTLALFFRNVFHDWSRTHLSEATTRLISDYIQTKKLDEKATPWTLYEARKVLSAFFSYAIREFEFPRNPVSAVKVPRIPKTVIDFIPAEGIAPTLTFIREEDSLLFPVCAIAIYAGLRRSEITWLERANLDMQLRTINVCRKMTETEEFNPKTNKGRVIPMSKKLFEILQAHLEGAASPTSEWAFLNSRGRRWNPDSMGMRLLKLMRRKNAKWTFQSFRHTFGSQLAQKGMSLYKISKLMGNSEEVCREHYAALQPSKMHEEVEFP